MDEAEREEYRRSRAEDVVIEQKILDAVSEIVKGTKWEVPNSVMTDVLVVMTSIDDDRDHMTVWINSGSWCTAEGMAHRVIRDVEARDRMRQADQAGGD